MAGRFKVEYRDGETPDGDWNLEKEELVESFGEATYELVLDLHATTSRDLSIEVLNGWALGGAVAESTVVDGDVTWRFTYVAG